MDKELEKTVNKIVMGFIKEMNNWERFCNEIENDEELNEDGLDKKMEDAVKIIFEKYCVPKERKQGRPNIISYGEEGSYEYDLSEKIIKIEQENKDKIMAYTKGRLKEIDEYMYIIKNYNGKWLIDTKKRYSTNKKWVMESL
jgi:hypothetical protein